MTPPEVETTLLKIHALLEQRAAEQAEESRQVRKAVYGNGDRGLMERVRNIEDFLSEMRKFRFWFISGVGALVLKAAFDAFTYFAQQGKGN